MVEVAPLPHEWMIIAIIGFFVSWLYIYGTMAPALGLERGIEGEPDEPGVYVQKWGATFMFFFVIVFIASIVSVSNAGTEDEHLSELAIHEKRKK